MALLIFSRTLPCCRLIACLVLQSIQKKNKTYCGYKSLVCLLPAVCCWINLVKEINHACHTSTLHVLSLLKAILKYYLETVVSMENMHFLCNSIAEFLCLFNPILPMCMHRNSYATFFLVSFDGFRASCQIWYDTWFYVDWEAIKHQVVFTITSCKGYFWPIKTTI